MFRLRLKPKTSHYSISPSVHLSNPEESSKSSYERTQQYPQSLTVYEHYACKTGTHIHAHTNGHTYACWSLLSPLSFPLLDYLPDVLHRNPPGPSSSREAMGPQDMSSVPVSCAHKPGLPNSPPEMGQRPQWAPTGGENSVSISIREAWLLEQALASGGVVRQP